MIKILLVMLGGGLGALCRYEITLIASRYIDSRFPWGTLFANLTGCLLIGVAFALAERSAAFPPAARLFFMTGFLGGLTTFSTYALEHVNAVRTGSHFMALVNFLMNNVGGAVLLLAGMWLTHLLLDRGSAVHGS